MMSHGMGKMWNWMQDEIPVFFFNLFCVLCFKIIFLLLKLAYNMSQSVHIYMALRHTIPIRIVQMYTVLTFDAHIKFIHTYAVFGTKGHCSGHNVRKATKII